MCTGSGKTIASLACISAAENCNGEASKNYSPVLVTVPTRVLANQWIEQIKRMGFPYVLRAYESSANWLGIIEPWMKNKNEDFPRFVVSTYKTFADERLLNKLTRLGDLGVSATWIADEMHNLGSTALLRAMEKVAGLFPNRIGLSATPEIEGNLPTTERLMRFFNGICATYELADGIRDGVLCPYRYHPFPAYLDPRRGEEYLQTLKGIEGAEHQPKELIEFYRKSREIVRSSGVQLPAFESMLDRVIAEGNEIEHTLVYCPPGFSEINADLSDDVQVDEGQKRLLEEVVSACRRRHFTVASIIGETPSSQRNEILERFASGDVQIL
jgi:superfamily II DNA or RNA helicase